MALPAEKFKPEMFMEERMARLEVRVEHIQVDVSEIKTDLRQLGAKVDDVKESIASLKVGRAMDRVWWLLMLGALLGIMARAFHWL